MFDVRWLPPQLTSCSFSCNVSVLTALAVVVAVAVAVFVVLNRAFPMQPGQCQTDANDDDEL